MSQHPSDFLAQPEHSVRIVHAGPRGTLSWWGEPRANARPTTQQDTGAPKAMEQPEALPPPSGREGVAPSAQAGRPPADTREHPPARARAPLRPNAPQLTGNSPQGPALLLLELRLEKATRPQTREVAQDDYGVHRTAGQPPRGPLAS